MSLRPQRLVAQVKAHFRDEELGCTIWEEFREWVYEPAWPTGQADFDARLDRQD